MMTIRNGDSSISGASCSICVNARVAESRPTKFASVTVGIPIEPNGVGVPFATRQTRQDNRGEKPRPASMPAGIAMAVPNPAIPSIKPPKHQPISNTRIRLSLDTLVIICLMTSILPVYRERLYVNTAAIITRMIGHNAIAKPSSAAVAVSSAGSFHTAIASMPATIIATKLAL